jgi:glycosyltransferase involved in cell wall biosynthesis
MRGGGPRDAAAEMTGQSNPRVLLACDWLLKYAAGLCGGLAAAGAKTVLLTRDHGLEFGGQGDEMRTEVRRLAGAQTAIWTVPGRIRRIASLPAVRALAAARRAFRPDVIHVQGGIEDDVRLLWAAGVWRGRYAYTCHDPTGHPGDPRHRAELVLGGVVLRRAALVFVHAETLRQELLSHHSISAPVVVLPHGIQEPTVAPFPAGPCVLFFGRIAPYKGLDVLLDAMDGVWTAQPATRLVVAGMGELPPHPALGDARVELRLGHVPEAEVPGLFASASVVALPYLHASQSGVGSLAKGFGRPIVVTAAGGLPELVADGSGVTVPPGDAPSLARALIRIIESPRVAEEMSRAGAASAAGGASWPTVGELTLAAYERHGLLPRSPAAQAGRPR